MNRFVDSAITYRILRLLVTPFDETEAFKLGIIDAQGNVLKRESELHTVQEKNAYTILHRLVFRLKRIIEKVPVENKKFLSMAAALTLIRECVQENQYEPIDLERRFVDAIPSMEDAVIIERFIGDKYLKPFSQFVEETGAAVVSGGDSSGIPANNASGEGVAGFTPETLGVGKRKPKMLRRKDKDDLETHVKPD